MFFKEVHGGVQMRLPRTVQKFMRRGKEGGEVRKDTRDIHSLVRVRSSKSEPHGKPAKKEQKIVGFARAEVRFKGRGRLV